MARAGPRLPLTGPSPAPPAPPASRPGSTGVDSPRAPPPSATSLSSAASSPSPPPAARPRGVLRVSWPLWLFNGLVAAFVAADFINLIQLSRLFWPDAPFNALAMGAFVTARLWTDGVCALGWGVLVDRLNRKPLFLINTSVTGLLVLANAFAPVGDGYSSYATWIAIRVLIGAFMSGGGPLYQSLSADLLEKDQRSRFFGTMSVVWQVCNVAGMVASAWLFQVGAWRWFYGTIGVGFLVVGAVVLARFPEPKRGSKERELRGVLARDDVHYDYTLSKETAKRTLLSRTNLLVFAEGFSSAILFGTIDIIAMAYVQTPPRNISAVVVSLFILIFGVSGGVVGTLLLARISDRYGTRRLRNRAYLIVLSIGGGIGAVLLMYSLPLPAFTPEQGADLGTMLDYPIFLAFGTCLFVAQALFSLYAMNQPPIIQAINLPEAQGTVRSWNQLVEIASYGTGPLLGGLILTWVTNDYQLAIQVICLLAIPSVAMWVAAARTVEADRARVQALLERRARDLAHDHAGTASKEEERQGGKEEEKRAPQNA